MSTIDINDVKKNGIGNSGGNGVGNSENPNVNDKNTTQQKQQIEDVVSGYE